MGSARGQAASHAGSHTRQVARGGAGSRKASCGTTEACAGAWIVRQALNAGGLGACYAPSGERDGYPLGVEPARKCQDAQTVSASGSARGGAASQCVGKRNGQRRGARGAAPARFQAVIYRVVGCKAAPHTIKELTMTRQ